MKKLGIPILTGIIILTLVYLHQLSILQEMPDEEWSRSVDLNVATDDSELFVQHQGDQSTTIL